jgi:hypothetical protein
LLFRFNAPRRIQEFIRSQACNQPAQACSVALEELGLILRQSLEVAEGLNALSS